MPNGTNKARIIIATLSSTRGGCCAITRVGSPPISAAVELKEKEKEIQLVGDGDFQIEQISTVLLGKLRKQNVLVSFLDMDSKIEKIGGDKVRQTYKIKAGIDSTLA